MAASHEASPTVPLMPSRRIINLSGFFACVGLMAYALYLQHGTGLEPCPLCVFQRLAVIGLGVLFLLVSLHNPQPFGARIYGALLGVVALLGVAVAGRHVWLQHLPADQVPACGPGLEYMLEELPLLQALNKVFSGSGECAEVDWSFLGLSMPACVLLWLVFLGVLGVVANTIVRRVG